MAAKEYLMNFGRAAAGQHYFVGFISLLSPQARGTSVKSWLFQSGRKGIFDESMVNWGPSLRSLPAIFTGQGHIYIVIPISECVCKEWLVNQSVTRSPIELILSPTLYSCYRTYLCLSGMVTLAATPSPITIQAPTGNLIGLFKFVVIFQYET